MKSIELNFPLLKPCYICIGPARGILIFLLMNEEMNFVGFRGRARIQTQATLLHCIMPTVLISVFSVLCSLETAYILW
jgi:hypothetical protein